MKRLLFAAIVIFPACSLYKSQGRKNLEYNLTDYGVHLSAANVDGCARGASLQEWTLADQTAEAALFTHEETGVFQLAVVPAQDQTLQCRYRFQSEDERQRKTPEAVDDTLKGLTTN